MGELDGRVACITGGTRGIGRAIAEAFVREGANVVITGRSVDKGKQALDEMQAGDAAHFVAGDVKDRAACEAAIEATVERYGRIDILVPNAGGSADQAPVVDMTDEAMQDALLWNFWHAFWTMRKALSYMIPQQFGRIMLMSSLEGKVGKPAISNYVVAKHAMNGLAKSAAHEVGTMGITVNALLPGIIETDIVRETGPDSAVAMGLESYDAMISEYTKESAIKRPNTVEQVAAVAVMLARDEARNITGCMFPIDGGTMPY